MEWGRQRDITWHFLAFIKRSFSTKKASSTTLVASKTFPPIFSAAEINFLTEFSIKSDNADIDGSRGPSTKSLDEMEDCDPAATISNRATADSSLFTNSFSIAVNNILQC